MWAHCCSDEFVSEFVLKDKWRDYIFPPKVPVLPKNNEEVEEEEELE